MNIRRPTVAHPARVAAVTTVLLIGLYVLFAGVLDVVIAARLTNRVDQRLAATLARAVTASSPQGSGRHLEGHSDLDDPPLILWTVDQSGNATLLSSSGPALPGGSWSVGPTTASFGGGQFRLEARVLPTGGHLVAGQSLAGVNHVRSVLLIAEALTAPLIAAVTFLLSLIIGIKAAAPIEQTRKRQLEFAADASHELRTPLSVIEAEVSLALSTSRDAAYCRLALERVAGESKRLRRIVEDLLWLARFDSKPPPPVNEPVDLGLAAAACVERFGPVAAGYAVALEARDHGCGAAMVKVPPEWIDRLLGVLVDNALRYSPAGGTVSVTVLCEEARGCLVVEDDGPGIPEKEHDRLFDRFHRASVEPGGAGLGLAIADAVVRSTEGRWNIGAAPAGGARMEISWPRVHSRSIWPSVTQARPKRADVGADAAEQKRTAERSQYQGADKDTSAEVGARDPAFPPPPVGKAQNERVSEMAENMEGHDAEPGDEARLVDEQQPDMPARSGKHQRDAAGE